MMLKTSMSFVQSRSCLIQYCDSGIKKYEKFIGQAQIKICKF